MVSVADLTLTTSGFHTYSVVKCTPHINDNVARHVNGFILEVISVILLVPCIQIDKPVNEMARLYSGLRLVSLRSV